jgi:phosphatidylinositol alpha 1,6-mannosyltransferase
VDRLAALDGLPGCRVVVVGDGPLRRQLEVRLPGATFLGFRTGQELSTVVASLDAFVHTGAHETFCQAAQEAMAAGVPVVAPAAGGPLDLVTHGQTGLLWQPDRPAELRAAVETLAASRRLRVAMGARARASVGGRTWEAAGEQLLGHYQSVLAGAGRPVEAA